MSAGNPGVIDSFTGPYWFLSNFYESPVAYRGVVYGSSEAAFQAAKCVERADRLAFANLTASASKRLGRRIVLRPDWEQVKVREMLNIVLAKFEQQESLTELLLDTGETRLVEGNTWGDRFWGVSGGQGRNVLGLILEEVRRRLRGHRSTTRGRGIAFHTPL